jgi:hypothetical protein
MAASLQRLQNQSGDFDDGIAECQAHLFEGHNHQRFQRSCVSDYPNLPFLHPSVGFSSRLSNVTMDTGIYVEGATNNVAYGVEQCRCPDKYNGSSCQNAAMGYYRWKNSTLEEEDGAGNLTIEDFIGHVVPCRCNRRSETCDTETGHCFVS